MNTAKNICVFSTPTLILFCLLDHFVDVTLAPGFRSDEDKRAHYDRYGDDADEHESRHGRSAEPQVRID
jgi:hypothetical protein